MLIVAWVVLLPLETPVRDVLELQTVKGKVQVKAPNDQFETPTRSGFASVPPQTPISKARIIAFINEGHAGSLDEGDDDDASSDDDVEMGKVLRLDWSPEFGYESDEPEKSSSSSLPEANFGDLDENASEKPITAQPSSRLVIAFLSTFYYCTEGP